MFLKKNNYNILKKYINFVLRKNNYFKSVQNIGATRTATA